MPFKIKLFDNFYCFLLPPCNKNICKQMQKADLDLNLDGIVKQNEKFYQHKLISLFIISQQETINNTAPGAANYINAYLFFVKDEEYCGTQETIILL